MDYFYQPLSPNRDPRSPSDPVLDSMLREMLLRETLRLSATEASGVTVTPSAAPPVRKRFQEPKAKRPLIGLGLWIVGTVATLSVLTYIVPRPVVAPARYP